MSVPRTLQLCFVGGLLLAIGVGVRSLWPDRDRKARNVILILVDTLRADHLGCYGYGRDTSPNLDAFARKAVVFSNNRSQSACTYPSVNSLLTSRDSLEFIDQPERDLGVPPEMPYLPQILHDNGYFTVGISTSLIVRDTPSMVNHTGGFGRGFDVFHEDCAMKPAACVNDALGAIEFPADKPAFVYLHYFDPHDPYHPPDRRRQFTKPYEGDKPFIADGDPNPIELMVYEGGPDLGLADADVRHLVDLYDEEIAYFDRQFARLMQILESRELLGDALVVFLSDHGEEFLEHGHIGHCCAVYESLIRTPLIVRYPGEGPRGHRDALTQNLDIVPTVLEAIGIPAAGYGFLGKSLRPLIDDHSDVDTLSYSSQDWMHAVIDPEFKLIYDIKQDSRELFDLRADPNERRNLAGEAPQAVQRLERELLGHLQDATGDPEFDFLGPENSVQEKLKALGYLR